MNRQQSILESLAGSAIGDALGLPYENLSARRAKRLLGPPERFRMFLGRGMVSDDAEHACMTAAALASCDGNVDAFARDLARRLRWWLLTIPAGIGLATLKSILKLWIGVSPARSGVWSAGNGPAMRAAIIGRVVSTNQLIEFVRASTSITHRDEKAFVGALAVALASAKWSASNAPGISSLLSEYGSVVPASPAATEMITLLQAVEQSLQHGEGTEDFAGRTCRRPGRVSGYIFESVPIALHAVYAHDTSLNAMRVAIGCGGDTDSVASIVGGIRGIRDLSMIDQLFEWPCDRSWLVALSNAAAGGDIPPRLPWATRLLRNWVMVLAIACHLVRRALPPY